MTDKLNENKDLSEYYELLKELASSFNYLYCNGYDAETDTSYYKNGKNGFIEFVPAFFIHPTRSITTQKYARNLESIEFMKNNIAKFYPDSNLEAFFVNHAPALKQLAKFGLCFNTDVEKLEEFADVFTEHDIIETELINVTYALLESLYLFNAYKQNLQANDPNVLSVAEATTDLFIYRIMDLSSEDQLFNGVSTQEIDSNKMLNYYKSVYEVGLDLQNVSDIYEKEIADLDKVSDDLMDLYTESEIVN